jgi:hypothetical protein
MPKAATGLLLAHGAWTALNVPALALVLVVFAASAAPARAIPGSSSDGNVAAAV